MKNLMLLLLVLLAAGCGCKDISCPSGQLQAFEGYLPGGILEYTDGTYIMAFSTNSSRQIKPVSVPAQKANEGFVRVCKPTQNCYEILYWEAESDTSPDSVVFEMELQVVTPAYSQAAVKFPEGKVTVNGDAFDFDFIAGLESPQAARTNRDTLIRNRRFATVLQFETKVSKKVHRIYLAQNAGVIGYTLIPSGRTFWRTDL